MNRKNLSYETWKTKIAIKSNKKLYFCVQKRFFSSMCQTWLLKKIKKKKSRRRNDVAKKNIYFVSLKNKLEWIKRVIK